MEKAERKGMTHMPDALARVIDDAWERRDEFSAQTQGEIREAVDAALDLLDSGEARVAEPAEAGEWQVHQWLKKAVLLSFRLNANTLVEGGIGQDGRWWDKVPSKFEGWGEDEFRAAGFRAVPPCAVRRGAYIARNAVLMPSYVNIGAYVGEGTMVDTWASVGSCAQVGADCHISAGTGIGGVLEPLQANPTIIEDGCFIGARSEIVEGVIVGEGSVIAMGVFITQSTRIVERDSGKVIYGRIPPYSVVVPGTLPDPKGGPSLACAVIVKTVDAGTRAKTGVNELLREAGA
jgi:2,3,4,5-tetrahydropyridine-2-carboxylate N-succinyltransferase